MISVGRSFRDAPEIDGYVLVEGDPPVGQIVPVRITGAMVYDLAGTVDTDAPTKHHPRFHQTGPEQTGSSRNTSTAATVSVPTSRF